MQAGSPGCTCHFARVYGASCHRGARNLLSSQIGTDCASGLKPRFPNLRRIRCMATLTGALELPAFGTPVASKTRVDYQNTQEGALVRRAQQGDEAAFREIV